MAPVGLVVDAQLGFRTDQELVLGELEVAHGLVEFKILLDFVHYVTDDQFLTGYLSDLERIIAHTLLHDLHGIHYAVSESAEHGVGIPIPLEIEDTSVVELSHTVSPACFVANLQSFEQPDSQQIPVEVELQTGDHEVVRVRLVD